MKNGRGSHVPTPSGRRRAQAGVQGEEAKPSLDAGEHDGKCAIAYAPYS